MWDYAELSKLAKESGGPEVLIETIKNTGLHYGRIEGVIVTVLLGGIIYGFCKAHEFFNDKIEKDENYIMAKEELINNINEIDNEENLNDEANI